MSCDEVMCRSIVPPPTQTKKELTSLPLFGEKEFSSKDRRLELEISDLRDRLDRRNSLLDVIRKAYHRDVLVIKECLLDAQRQGQSAVVSDTRNVESLLNTSLATVPSLDLRETFRLFAPQECELRVRPCWSCGGQLEVIHRESSRIVNLKHSIQLLGEREKNLRLELVDAKVCLANGNQRLVDVMEKSNNEREVLMEQILSLKHQVADRNALEVEVQQLKEDKRDLESTLEEQKPILINHERLLVEIEEVKDNAKQWQAKYHEQAEHNRLLESENACLRQKLGLVEQANNQLQKNLDEAQDQVKQSNLQCSTLTQDLSRSQATTKEVEACLTKAEHAIDELESEFQQEEQKLKTQISSLEFKCSQLESTIADLEEESQKNANEALHYRSKIETTLEGARRRGSIAFVPQNSDAAFAKTDELIRETETLRHKTAILFNLLLGCIRSTYENCLVQEKLLLDNSSELHRNNQRLKSSSEPTNDKARMVLNHLGNADESDVIDWASILVDETDQRHIMGNLQNRLQMGQFSLEKTFHKIYKSHASEVHRCQDEHDKQIEERRLRIWYVSNSIYSSLD